MIASQQKTILLFFILCLGIVSGGCEKPTTVDKKSPTGPPPAVLVTEVLQQTVPIYREFTARTAANETVDIRARVEGILEEQLFEEGKMVEKDQILFRIDTRAYDAALMSAKARQSKAEADLAYALQQVSVRAASAELAQANARLEQQTKELDRTTNLVKQGVQTQQDLDTITARYQAAVAESESRQAQLENAILTESANIRQASAALEMAKAEVTTAQLNLSYCTIRSPLKGLIGLVQVDVGNLVGRGEPTLLATISGLDPIRVLIGLSEADYLRLAEPGKRKKERSEFEMVLADGSIYPYKGTFLMADRAVDLKTGTLQIIAAFPNPDNFIRPGQFARVRIALEYVENALVIPQKAVIEQQSARVVYVVGADNKVEFRTVVLGERFEDKFIITEGLKAGEKIIIEGQLKARPGMPVTPSDEPVTQEPSEQPKEN